MSRDAERQTDQAADRRIVERLDDVYASRFDDADAERKDQLWKVIARHLQRYVPRDGVVLDLACDRGDFIRNIDARERWASDLRDMSEFLPEPIRFVRSDGLLIAEKVPTNYFDLVFMSNYLEHLPDGAAVIEQLRAVAAVLKPGGKVMVLQPNISLTGNRYWDFIDHGVALNDRSLIEAAELASLGPELLIRRFLPYTTKGRLPVSARLASVYLRVRPAWTLFGKQSLLIATKPQ
jgi:SAM-dependent methyltransferase